jgi:hypothetical protein
MKQYKIDFSTFFNDMWTRSPIHWSGHNLDISGLNSWLFFKFNQGMATPKSLSNDGIYSETILIDCILYAKNELELADMYDELREMLHENTISDLVLVAIDVDDEDVLKTTQGDFNYLDLSLVFRR